MPKRRTRVGRMAIMAGCYDCDGGEARWFGGNAQGVAARHHDATGHETWVETAWSIRYGGKDAEPPATSQKTTSE